MSVKICPTCGKSNPETAIFCVCKTDLTDTIVSADFTDAVNNVPPTAEGAEPKLFLVTESRLVECPQHTVLGREGNMMSDWFAGVATVSRRHAIISRDGSKWYLTPISSTNPTYLGGVKLEVNERCELNAGDHELQLSNQCAIKLRVTA